MENWLILSRGCKTNVLSSGLQCSKCGFPFFDAESLTFSESVIVGNFVLYSYQWLFYQWLYFFFSIFLFKKIPFPLSIPIDLISGKICLSIVFGPLWQGNIAEKFGHHWFSVSFESLFLEFTQWKFDFKIADRGRHINRETSRNTKVSQ